MSNYIGVNGQSLLDISLNTYGTLDNHVKLLTDSGINSLDTDVATGQTFTYDPLLITDQNAFTTTTIQGVRFATSASGSGNTFAITEGSAKRVIDTTGYAPAFTGSGKTYKTSQTQYVALSDNETSINLSALIGKDIFAIEKEIKPLSTEEWSWNKNTGYLTLTNGMYTGETLFIYFQELVNI